MMQRFRKIGAASASMRAATGFKNPAKLPRFSTWTTDTVPTIQEQPKNDGFVYFASEAEKQRTKVMEENFERLLNSYATSEERQTLIQLLGMDEAIICILLYDQTFRRNSSRVKLKNSANIYCSIRSSSIRGEIMERKILLLWLEICTSNMHVHHDAFNRPGGSWLISFLLFKLDFPMAKIIR